MENLFQDLLFPTITTIICSGLTYMFAINKNKADIDKIKAESEVLEEKNKKAIFESNSQLFDTITDLQAKFLKIQTEHIELQGNYNRLNAELISSEGRIKELEKEGRYLEERNILLTKQMKDNSQLVNKLQTDKEQLIKENKQLKLKLNVE